MTIEKRITDQRLRRTANVEATNKNSLYLRVKIFRALWCELWDLWFASLNSTEISAYFSHPDKKTPDKAEQEYKKGQEILKFGVIQNIDAVFSELFTVVSDKVSLSLDEPIVPLFEADFFNNPEDPTSIEFIASLILHCSNYPSWVPVNNAFVYNPQSRILGVSLMLPLQANLPTVKLVSYCGSRASPKFLTAKEQSAFYESVTLSIILRTAHEVFCSKRLSRFVDAICVNGYVSTTDRSTGIKIEPVIASLFVSRDDFECLTLSYSSEISLFSLEMSSRWLSALLVYSIQKSIS